jgi:DNA helicase-2/ATP-dependent DNA helicase PcrA
MRLSLNRESIADLKRVINVPPRGIGKTTLLKIVEGREALLPASMRIRIASFRNLLERIKNFGLQNPPSKTVFFVAEEVGLNQNLEKTEEGTERIENIKELGALASMYDHLPPEDGLGKLLEDTSLVSDQDSDQKEKDGVRLMTIHASKGLEFAYVFVTGLEEGLFPHNKDGANPPVEHVFWPAYTNSIGRAWVSVKICPKRLPKRRRGVDAIPGGETVGSRQVFTDDA